MPGFSLTKMKKKAAVIDFNFTTPHLSLYFGLHSCPLTLNSFLRREADLEDVIYNHPSGLDIVPASLDVMNIINTDTIGLKETLKDVFWDYDFVILDSAPGLGREAIISMKASDEIIFVANPQIPSLVDVVKCLRVINSLDPKPKPMGLIVNKVKRKNFETTLDEIINFTELPILGVVPEDNNVLETENKKTVITLHRENSSSSIAFFNIASKIADVPYQQPGFFDYIRSVLFRKKETTL